MGYRDYHEALELEVSRRDVSQTCYEVATTYNLCLGGSCPLEDRLDRPTNFLGNPNITIYGQNRPELCKSLWISESSWAERQGVQLFVWEYALNFATFGNNVLISWVRQWFMPVTSLANTPPSA